MSALLSAGQVEHIVDMAALTATALAAFGDLDEQAFLCGVQPKPGGR